MRRRTAATAGFMLAPLLYMLALAGIGAAVMFSGYSQILRSNAEMTAVNTARSQLQAAGQTLSASAVLDSATSTIVQPPAVYSAATVAGGSDAARLPTSYANAGTSGTPHDVGVIDVSSGVKQLDPWGKFYIYCRWENPVSTPAAPSITVVSAGPDGTLQTKCGDTAAQGDDRIITSTVAETINRANVWQVSSSSQVKYGIDSNAVKVNQDGSMTAGSLTLNTPLALTSGGTGAATAGAARTNLGSTATGDALFTAASAAAGRGTLGSTTVGDAVFIAASAGAGRTALGATATGDALFTAATAAAGRTTLGSTTVGDALFITATAAAGRTTLGSTATGDALFTAASAGAARTTLGSTTVGDALFISASAAAGRNTLGLGTMAVQNANAVAITGGTITGVDLSGSTGGTAGSVAATGITGCCVAIASGGTGAGDAATARSNLGTNNASNITTGTFDTSLLPNSGVTAGTYTWGTVNAKGIVTAANNVSTSQISQGDSGVSVDDSGSNGTITFTNDGVVTVTIDHSGNVGIGTAAPTQKLDVYGGNIAIRGAAASNRSLIYTTAATNRWAVYTNSTAEGGSNAGSDYVITSYNDAGTALANVLTLTRSTGAAVFAGALTASGGLVGNLTGNVVGNVTGNISGNISLSDGTVATPGLYFTNDTNSGLYRVGADVMGLSAGGTDVLRLTGSTSNVNYLNISGAAASSSPSIAAAGTDTNVGIVVTPKGNGAVYVTGSASLADFRVSNTNNNPTGKYIQIETNYGSPSIHSYGYGQPLYIDADSSIRSGSSWLIYSSSVFSVTGAGGIAAGHGPTSCSSYSTKYGIYICNYDPNTGTPLIVDTGSATHNSAAFKVLTGGNPGLVVSGTGLVGIGTSSPGEKLDVVGDIRATNFRTRSLTRTLPTTVDDTVDIGTFTFTNGGGALWVSVTVPSSGYSTVKQYVLPISYAEQNNTWAIVQPVGDTGAYGGNNFEMDVYVSGATALLRLRRTAGSTAGTAYVLIKQEGVDSNTFTASTATASVTAPTVYYNATQIRQVDGNVGIGTSAPAATVDIGAYGSTPNVRLTGIGSLEFYRPTQSHWKLQHMANGFAIQNSWSGGTYNSAISLDDGLGITTTPTLKLAYSGGAYNVGIGTATPNASAKLDVFSTTGGLLPPRMTSGQVSAIASPANGLLVYDSTIDRYKAYQGGSWQEILTSATGNVPDDSLDFDKFKDAMTLDASTDIAVTGANVLSITNTGTGNSFVVNDQASDTTPFVIDASGNVGIGTAVPSERLHVSGGNALFEAIGGNNVRVTLKPSNSASGILSFQNSSRVEKATISSTDGSDNLAFYTLGSPRLWIKSDGLVGIGTTTPGSILAIGGDAARTVGMDRGTVAATAGYA